MPRLLTASLVRAVRTHGALRAGPGPDAPRWRQVADGSRALALGLGATGVAPGRTARVDATGLTAVEVVERELAVLATGALLRVGEAPADPGDVVVGRTAAHLGGAGAERPLADLRQEGRGIDAARPSAHEEAVAALAPEAPAVADGARVVSQAEAGWALRAIDRWLQPAVGSHPPRIVSSPSPAPGTELVAALVARWWPALAGGAVDAPGADLTSLHGSRPDVLVLAPDEWALLARALREAASRTVGGRALLRAGRAVGAGEAATRAERAGAILGGRWVGARLRAEVGLGSVSVGVVLGAPGPVDARDLATAGVPVTPTWVEPGIPAPVASAAVHRRVPPTPWLRPLPGRAVEVAAGTTTVRGDDLPAAGLAVGTVVDVDHRGRVRPRRPADGGRRR